MPNAPILFNHIYLFTKKYQNITYKLFWVSMNISHPIGPQIFPILLSKLGHDINHHKNLKNSYLFKFYYHYLAKSKTTPTSPMHTSRVVYQKPKTNPPTQTARADPTPVTFGDRSSPQKTDLGRSDGGFSSPKPDEPDPINETRERRSDLPRSI